MAKSREIKGRMKAVDNIQRITRTMQMIATARFQSALRRATSSKPYSAKIAELVGELAAAGGSLDHPLLRAPEASNSMPKQSTWISSVIASANLVPAGWRTLSM